MLTNRHSRRVTSVLKSKFVKFVGSLKHPIFKNKGVGVYKEEQDTGNAIDKAFETYLQILLKAEAQQGKSGTFLVVMERFIKRNHNNEYAIIYLSHMADCSIRDNAKAKISQAFGGNQSIHVIHRGELRCKKDLFQGLNDRKIPTLVILDEAHVALHKNGEFKNLFCDTIGIQYGKDPSTWENKFIKTLSVSATGFPQDIQSQCDEKSFFSVIMARAATYYGSPEMLASGRAKPIGDMLRVEEKKLHLENGSPVLGAVFVAAMNIWKSVKRNTYFLIRLPVKFTMEFEAKLRQEYPWAEVMKYSCADGNIRALTGTGEAPLPSVLESAPNKPTIILIKHALGAGVTICKEHIGAVWETATQGDDTHYQRVMRHGGHGAGVYTYPIYCDMDMLKRVSDYVRQVDGALIPSCRYSKGQKTKFGGRNLPTEYDLTISSEPGEFGANHMDKAGAGEPKSSRSNLAYQLLRGKPGPKSGRDLRSTQICKPRNQKFLSDYHALLLEGLTDRYGKVWKGKELVGMYVHFTEKNDRLDQPLNQLLRASCMLN